MLYLLTLTASTDSQSCGPDSQGRCVPDTILSCMFNEGEYIQDCPADGSCDGEQNFCCYRDMEAPPECGSILLREM